jgi:hypothetical protein
MADGESVLTQPSTPVRPMLCHTPDLNSARAPEMPVPVESRRQTVAVVAANEGVARETVRPATEMRTAPILVNTRPLFPVLPTNRRSAVRQMPVRISSKPDAMTSHSNGQVSIEKSVRGWRSSPPAAPNVGV